MRLTAREVVLSETESTALSAVTVHVVTCQLTELIAGDLLTLGRAVHVVTAFNIPHVLTRTPCIVRVGRVCCRGHAALQ